MNETVQPSPESKKEAAKGGMSKKDRRALKVAAKQGTKEEGGANVKAVRSKEAKLSEPLKQNEINKQDDIKVEVESSNVIATNAAPPENNQAEDKKSKKERRAQKVKSKESLPEKKVVNENNENNVQKEKEVTEVKAEGTQEKSKAQLKAERRELQEKQRLAKVQAKEKPEPVLARKDSKEDTKTPPKVARQSSRKISYRTKVVTTQVQLFNHLHLPQLTPRDVIVVKDVHPSFIRLGAQYASKTVLGSNARCLALLHALSDLIEDFVTPQNQELCRSLETCLQTSVEYLQRCRPFAVSMTNALRHFKVHTTQVKRDLPDDEKKRELLQIVDTYIDDEIYTAGRAISMKVSEKICNGDVILTFGCSSLIKKILMDAHEDRKVFKVIIVDSRPLLEGREMLRKLVNGGIDCSYMLINAVSYIMSQATKVLLGAHALLANGYVMARTGTAQVALVARAYNKPVLVCCETYKFCERVQTDSFVYNELGDPGSLVEKCQHQKKTRSLTPLSLMYDVTPPDLVTAVVTELGFLPCTSVPVVLRIKPTE